jgi:hypothetical protein
LSAVSGASSVGCAEVCEAPDGIFSSSSWGGIAGADTAASFRRLMDRSKRTAARRTTEETQQHAFVGGIEQIVPRRRRAQSVLARNFALVMNTKGSSAIAVHIVDRRGVSAIGALSR